MGSYDSVAALVAVAAATAVVLRHTVTYDRPPAEKAPPPPKKAKEPKRPAPRRSERPVAPGPSLVEDGSILAALAATEHDEHPLVRRVGALVVLLGLTVLTAVGLGLLIYRSVSGLK